MTSLLKLSLREIVKIVR